MPNLVLIIGPQAVGKMTVGQELSKMINYKLFHNHMTIELLTKIFDYDQEIFRKMNTIIREEIFKEFAKSNEKGMIFTCCFDFGSHLEEEKERADTWIDLFDEAYVVELEASLEERLKRNETENRLKHKESKRNLEWSKNDLIRSMTKHRLNSNPGEGEKVFKNYIKINNENLSPEEVAKMIKEKFKI